LSGHAIRETKTVPEMGFEAEGTLVNPLYNLQDREWQAGHSIIYIADSGS
jgi:hypothetical protein